MRENASSADNQQGRLNVKLTPDYIVGLADGEGYFSVSAIVSKSNGWNCHNVRMVFGIKLNAEDGKILYDLKDFFGCGKVRFRKDDRKKFCNCLEFQVSDSKSIKEIIIPFFQKNPLKFPKKKKAFKKFVEIAIMKERKEHIGTEGFLRAKQLAGLLHS